MDFVLPFPPTVNTYYRRHGHHIHISNKGRKFKLDVLAIVAPLPTAMEGRLDVLVRLYPPNHRKWDIDNRVKPLLDALEESGVYTNDNQVDTLRVERCGIFKPYGKCEVTVIELAKGEPK